MLGKGVMKCMREFVCLLLQQIEGEVEGGWQAHLKCALDPLTCLLSPFKISTQLFSRFYRVASWPRVSLVSRGVGGNLFASNLKIGNLYLCICEFAYLSALLAAVWRKSFSQQSQNWETAAISLSFKIKSTYFTVFCSNFPSKFTFTGFLLCLDLGGPPPF